MLSNLHVSAAPGKFLTSARFFPESVKTSPPPMCPEFGCNHSTSGISYPRAPSAQNVAQRDKRTKIDQIPRHASTILAVNRWTRPDLRRILNNVASRRAQTLKHDLNLGVHPPLRVLASMTLRFFARPALTIAKTSTRKLNRSRVREGDEFKTEQTNNQSRSGTTTESGYASANAALRSHTRFPSSLRDVV